MADVFTPLIKLVSSEYCNQLAYDAIQIHGGTGFMKDFPVERIYRDARITTIYEGTSQLQVVAAIRGVKAGSYLARIREYEEIKVKPEFEFLRRTLIMMTQEYEVALNRVKSVEDDEYLDFHARRLVEMAGNIIMGYLLIFDAMQEAEFKQSAEIFIKKAHAENKEKADYISNFDIKELAMFKH